MVYEFFDKKSQGRGLANNNNNKKENIQLADKLHKPIIRKFKKRKVYYLETIFGVLIWQICSY